MIGATIRLNRCRDCISYKVGKCYNNNIVSIYIKDKKIPKQSKMVKTRPESRACRFFEKKKTKQEEKIIRVKSITQARLF